MGLIEVFEFRMNDNSVAEIHANVRIFKSAIERISDIQKVEFLIAKDNPSILWQIIEWKTDSASPQGMKEYFSLPEMGMFSNFMIAPPRRIENFLRI